MAVVELPRVDVPHRAPTPARGRAPAAADWPRVDLHATGERRERRGEGRRWGMRGRRRNEGRGAACAVGEGRRREMSEREEEKN